MRIRFSLALVLIAGLVGGLLVTQGSSGDNLGKKIENLTFKDAAGKMSSLYDLKNKKAIVIVFLSFDCPVSKSYSQPLSDMATEFGKQNVAFIGLTTNQDETPAEVAKYAKEHNLAFPVYLDAKFAIANALGANVTPEAFVLDGQFRLNYRGRIDDSYYARLKKNQQITQHNVRQVLGEILSGRPISNPVTEAVGCAIPRTAKEAPKVGEVTYHRDVLPILQNNCQSCHRQGEVGPFSLMTYKQAVNWAPDIKEYTQKRLMPPWKPTSGLPFHNERRLSHKELATLAAWADNGTPEGDPKDAPPKVKFPEGWTLGKPDLVLTVPDDYQIGPTGSDVFRCFVLPTNLPEDVYVSAVEVRPGNPRVVHHALLFIDTSGQGRKLQQQARDKDKEKKANDDPKHRGSELDRGPGYSVSMGVGFLPAGGLGGWAPGQIGRYLPDGTGIRLPKASDVVMQLHYHRNGRTEKDRTSVGIYFAQKKVDKVYQGGVIPGLFFAIPPGEEKFPVKGSMWATGDLTLHSIMPHMHMIGKRDHRHHDAARGPQTDADRHQAVGLQLARDVSVQRAGADQVRHEARGRGDLR